MARSWARLGIWRAILVLACCLGGSLARAESETKIKLLSDEAADACIADVSCLRGLFLQAALGARDGAVDGVGQVVKWSGPVRMVRFTGAGLGAEAQAPIASALGGISVLGRAAGVDIGAVMADDVVNLVLLISDDFDRDREAGFADLFSTVFAGRAELYDQLTAGERPICASASFVEETGDVGGGVAFAEAGSEATRLERCLSREALQMLGLRFPLGEATDSLLNPTSDRQAWTSVDFVLLKLLYHPMIEPGMGAEEIAALFPRLYEATLRPAS